MMHTPPPVAQHSASGPGKERAATWQLLAVPVLFYLGARLSLAFAIMPDVLVMLWIPNSIVLAWLLRHGFRLYPVLAAGIIGAEVAADYASFPLIEAVLFGAINLLEATAAFVLLRRWRFDARFAAPTDIAKFVIAGPIAATLLSAAGAAAVYRHFSASDTGYTEYLRVWWFSDGLGLLILTPLVLGLWPLPGAVASGRTPLRWYDVIAIVASGALVITFAFVHSRTFHGLSLRPFLLIAPALYVAARFSPRAASAVAAVLALFLLYLVADGRQPFGDLPVAETAASTQELIFVMGTLSLGFAALLAQQRANARELEARVRERTAALSTANRQLEQLAITDSLTGLLNRRAFFDVLEREMQREQRHPHALALILFDLDHFKAINDRFGHAAGDAVLRRAAELARGALRGIDSLARYGGEEFIILAPETREASARQLAERVRAALGESEFSADGQALRVTASFGVTLLQPDDRTPQQLVRRADQALYAAKAAGRDRVVFA